MPVPLSGPSLREKLRQAFDSSSPVPEAPADAGGRPAGVLVPVVDEDDPTVVFTKRADELPRHPGEISFPGGVRHPDDRDLLETALRETDEELGLPRGDIE